MQHADERGAVNGLFKQPPSSDAPLFSFSRFTCEDDAPVHPLQSAALTILFLFQPLFFFPRRIARSDYLAKFAWRSECGGVMCRCWPSETAERDRTRATKKARGKRRGRQKKKKRRKSLAPTFPPLSSDSVGHTSFSVTRLLADLGKRMPLQCN